MGTYGNQPDSFASWPELLVLPNIGTLRIPTVEIKAKRDPEDGQPCVKGPRRVLALDKLLIFTWIEFE